MHVIRWLSTTSRVALSVCLPGINCVVIHTASRVGFAGACLALVGRQQLLMQGRLSVCVWHWLVVNNYLCRVVVSVCVWPWLVVNNYLYSVVVSVCV